ncbi:hypothetical protein ACP275_12G053800 [Erythranthe tilingii]
MISINGGIIFGPQSDIFSLAPAEDAAISGDPLDVDVDGRRRTEMRALVHGNPSNRPRSRNKVLHRRALDGGGAWANGRHQRRVGAAVEEVAVKILIRGGGVILWE